MCAARGNRIKLLQLLVFTVFLVTCRVSSAAHFYVATNGDDANSGLGPDGNKAFKTIQAGVNLLRAGDTLSIRGGVYRETVVFPHSGTMDSPITVEPYENEKVIISGCEPIAGWVKFKDNIWKAPMDWTLGLGRNQVFYDGDVLIEARYPNKPDPGLEMPVTGLSKLWPTFGRFSIPIQTGKTTARPGCQQVAGGRTGRLLEGRALLRGPL